MHMHAYRAEIAVAASATGSASRLGLASGAFAAGSRAVANETIE